MAATATTVSNLPQILKIVFRDELDQIRYKKAPLYAMIPKDESMPTTFKVQIKYSDGGGRSNTFADALSGISPSVADQMSITTSDKFTLFRVDHKLITLSRNDRLAVVRAVTERAEGALDRFKRSVCMELYGSTGGGSVGQGDGTAANITTTTWKFTSKRATRYLDVGAECVFSAGSGDVSGDVLRAINSGTANSLTVAGVNRKTGDVTFSAAPNTITGAGVAVGVSDYVFIKGDFKTALYGLAAYVPPSDPSTTIWGMTRTTDPVRLAGNRVGGKGLLIHEAIKKALKDCQLQGGDPKTVFMSPDDFLALDLQLGTQRVYSDTKVAGVGFTGIEIVEGGTKVSIYADGDCPVNSIWCLDMDTWKLSSAGAYPMPLEEGEAKNKFMVYDKNEVEGRWGGYAQAYCTLPGANAFLDLTAVPS